MSGSRSRFCRFIFSHAYLYPLSCYKVAASRKLHTLPGPDILSATRSSFRILGGGAGFDYENSTNNDALSHGFDLGGSARKSMLRDGSEERSTREDLLNNEDPLMNDTGFDLFGGDLGGLDFAAMVDAEHAAAKQGKRRHRRVRADGSEIEEEEVSISEVC